MMYLYDVESEFYDVFYFDYRDDIEFYRKFLCDNVLELMCGTGRILYYLNPNKGVGIDINEKMVHKAMENLKGKNIRILRGDARDFMVGEKFCLVIIGLNSLLMFPREDRIKILSNARKHLSDSGVLIVDVMNPLVLIENMVYHGDTREYNGKIYTRFFVPRIEGDHWNILYFYDIVEGEKIRRKYAQLRLYMPEKEELEDEFREAKLKIEKVYGDYDFSEYSEESERIIVVARK